MMMALLAFGAFMVWGFLAEEQSKRNPEPNPYDIMRRGRAEAEAAFIGPRISSAQRDGIERRKRDAERAAAQAAKIEELEALVAAGKLKKIGDRAWSSNSGATGESFDYPTVGTQLYGWEAVYIVRGRRSTRDSYLPTNKFHQINTVYLKPIWGQDVS